MRRPRIVPPAAERCRSGSTDIDERQDPTVGAWGNGPFENDDALDLVGELVDTARPLADVLMQTLGPSSARRPGFLARLLRRGSEDEGDDANDFTTVAAAAVVAAALGLDVGNDQVGDLLAKQPMTVSDQLRATARSALARATGPDSEWYELWEESGELERTQAETDRVRQVLEQAGGGRRGDARR